MRHREPIEPRLACRDCGGARLDCTHRFQHLPSGGVQVTTTGDCTECGTSSETVTVANLSDLVIRGRPIDDTEPNTIPRMLIARLIKRTGSPRNGAAKAAAPVHQSPTAVRIAASMPDPGQPVRRASPTAHLRKPKRRD